MDKDTNFSSFTVALHKKIRCYDAPVLMGILNVTPDSFFDGGKYTTEDSILARAQQIIDEGGDIIDIGVTSTRPGSTLPDPKEESQRLAHIVSFVRQHFHDAVISADTCFALSACLAIESGADIINDIGGGIIDSDMFDTVASLQVPYILSHYETFSGDPLLALSYYFSDKLEQLYRKGAKDVWIDPGFGFKKDLQQNFDIFQCLPKLCHLFAEPLLVGVSNKSMIYKTLDTSPTHPDTLTGTIALNTQALLAGARILRVHDVREAAIIRTLLQQQHSHH